MFSVADITDTGIDDDNDVASFFNDDIAVVSGKEAESAKTKSCQLDTGEELGCFEYQEEAGRGLSQVNLDEMAMANSERLVDNPKKGLAFFLFFVHAELFRTFTIRAASFDE